MPRGFYTRRRSAYRRRRSYRRPYMKGKRRLPHRRTAYYKYQWRRAQAYVDGDLPMPDAFDRGVKRQRAE